MSDTMSNVELAAELTAAWLSNPNTRTSADDVPAFLITMHAAVTKLSQGGEPAARGRSGARVRSGTDALR